MFIKNITKKDVPSNSKHGFTFDGYGFEVPPGVSAIWTPAGEAMLKTYKVESQGGTDKYGYHNGNGLPALVEATEKEWIKDGKKLIKVERFQIEGNLIPRNSLIKVALQRGISHDRIAEYQLDENIDVDEIAQDINSLPIPDEVKYPVSIEDNNDENKNSGE